MSKNKEMQYMPVQDSSNAHLTFERERIESNPTLTFKRLLMLEGFHLVLLLGAYVLYLTAKYRSEEHNEVPKVHGLDTCK